MEMEVSEEVTIDESPLTERKSLFGKKGNDWTQKLIRLVKQKSLIYDPSHEDYKNKPKVAEAWSAIAREMGIGDNKLWTYRWKNLRDNYKKFLKSADISTSTYRKYKHWPWAPQMEFLNESLMWKSDNYEEPEIPSVTESSPHMFVARPTCASATALQDPDLSCPNQSYISYSMMAAKTSHNKAKRKRARRDNSESDEENANVSSLDRNESKIEERLFDMDDIDHLFLSYASNLKRMPSRVQSLIKLDMATLFARYELQIHDQENGNDNPVNSSPASPQSDPLMKESLTKEPVVVKLERLD